jgi:hypothetical protein
MKIDSLTKYEELLKTGIPENQASELAHSLAKASELDFSSVASKDDISRLETATKNDIRQLHVEIKHIEKSMYTFGLLIFSCLGYLIFMSVK